MTAFPHLFSPIDLGSVTVKNRILSSGHDTVMAENGMIGDRLIAYHRARAQGGTGLIVIQVAGVHESAKYSSSILMADTDECIPGYRKLVDAVRPYGTTLFGQLFHDGREMMESQDGSLAVALAPSAVPNERFHVMPRAMPVAPAAPCPAAGLARGGDAPAGGPSQWQATPPCGRPDNAGTARRGRHRPGAAASSTAAHPRSRALHGHIVAAGRYPAFIRQQCKGSMSKIITLTLNPALDITTSTDRVSPGLMAVGEAGCASVHGANRLGSNSLIDLVVFGRAAAIRAGQVVDREAAAPSINEAAVERIMERFDRLRHANGGSPTPISTR